MSFATFILAGALAAIPKVPVLDFSKLPVPGGQSYSFEIQLQLENREKVNCRGINVGIAGDREMAMLVANTHLKNEDCSKYEDGLRLIILDCAGKKITGVKVIGDGPKPIVRWMLRPDIPPKKK